MSQSNQEEENQPFDFNAAFGMSNSDGKVKKRQKKFIELKNETIAFDFYYTRKIKKSSYLEVEREVFVLTIVDFVSEENLIYHNEEERDLDYERLKDRLTQEGIKFV